MNKNVKARELRASVKYITVAGKQMKMVFSNLCYMMLEDMYYEKFGRDIGFEAILKESAKGKLKAILSAFYCALKAGGNELPEFDEWANSFDLEALTTITTELLDGIKDTLPDPGEEQGKNA